MRAGSSIEFPKQNWIQKVFKKCLENSLSWRYLYKKKYVVEEIIILFVQSVINFFQTEKFFAQNKWKLFQKDFLFLTVHICIFKKKVICVCHYQ